MTITYYQVLFTLLWALLPWCDPAVRALCAIVVVAKRSITSLTFACLSLAKRAADFHREL